MGKSRQRNVTLPDSSDGAGVGCLPVILFITVMWALVFGVTWEGKHYGMSCSCDRGVAIDNGVAK